ncbi:MAG: cell envelope biogenesis protein OmpA [Rhodobacteraceae bacterium]|nr:MAG: cell envelope biogenesis protein OmpA [Paracoccaceae bacterium]
MPVMASDLALPAGAQILAERPSPLARYALPLGPASDDKVPVRHFEGQVLRRTWRLGGDATTLQLFAPMRQQLQEAGYDIAYQCQALDCGGFEFRFGIEVVPAPDMIVDIGDFLFLSATKGEAQALSLLVSRSGSSAYIQVIEVAPVNVDLIKVTATQAPVPEIVPDQVAQADERDLIGALSSSGRVVLADLEFETGSARLGAGPFDSLAQLATALTENPEMRVMLVGHTDNIGAQDGNVALSQLRAEAVRERLLTLIEADVAGIEVVGAGFMAPLTSNLTREGRDANRRVEAVLMSQ